jgi:AraC-like DNA-binding protein
LTIHEAIQISRELIASYNSGLHIWLERQGDQVRYCQKYTKELPRERITEIVQLGLMNAMSQAYDLVGSHWQVKRIELASDPVDLTMYFPELANVPVAFAQPFTSVWVHQSVMTAPVRSFDVSADKLRDGFNLDFYLKSGPSSDPIGQLEQAIQSVLNHPRMSVRLAASIIGTSVRTLQRQLTEQDTSFSRLLQAIRFRMAQQLLEDPKMPLKEIANRLGYTDLANFMRAFKRWTGLGPSQYRRLHYEPEHERREA